MSQNRSPSEFKPLAPSIVAYPYFGSPFRSPEDPQHPIISETQISRLKKCVLFCGCITALLVIFFVILIVLAFTVYNVKDLKVKINRVTLVNGTLTNGATENLTVLNDVSVKNTNYFTYKYSNSTTTFFYDGVAIGEGVTPAGKAKARRTMRLNVTSVVVTKKLVGIPNWAIDIRDDVFNISSYTRIDGKVKVLGMFNRKVVVEMNCTSQYNRNTGLITRGNNCLGNIDI
ncbi:uncharacterized protein LOC130716128 [Lotus japonicus]|uniref:Late embryogenesis abundant protein LEA-2 subgroup domain-containing protein n=1 Tax=Lotus japonicus TaxID=34305 RepID=I3T2L5_LOTJA|nr:uncharacterized protein LOC130716128 [Lotus japonicus]AFK46757.1 unknown [Lotus japonicus]